MRRCRPKRGSGKAGGIRLRPCPFCGATTGLYVASGDAVYCSGCGAEGPYPSDDQLEIGGRGKSWDEWTVELWNKRRRAVRRKQRGVSGRDHSDGMQTTG